MKHAILFVFAFLMLCGFNLKAQDPPVQVCDVKISFGSPGTGIDGKTYAAINDLLKEKKIASSEKHFGREGETEICLSLNGMKRRKKKDFIKQLKKTAAAGRLVSVSVS